MAYIYDFATHLLALVFLTSALSKLIQQRDMQRSDATERFARSAAFAATEFLLGLALLVPLPAVVHAAAAIAIATIVGVGQWRRARAPDSECECLGSLTPGSPWLYAVLGVVVFAGTTAVVGVALSQPLAAVPFNGWFAGGTLAVLVVIERKLRYDQTTGQGYARRWVDLTRITHLPGDLLLGERAGQAVSTRDLVNANKPALILAVSPHCHLCHDVYALLSVHAKLLSEEVNLVVIAPNADLYTASPIPSATLLVDASSHLSRFLGLRPRPYALLVTSNLKLQAPPSQTSQTAQRLILVLVKMVNDAIANRRGQATPVEQAA